MKCLTRYYCDFYFIFIINAMLLLPIVCTASETVLCRDIRFSSRTQDFTLNQNGLWHKSKSSDITMNMTWKFCTYMNKTEVWPGYICFYFVCFEDEGVTQAVHVDICLVCSPKHAVEFDWMKTFSLRFILFYCNIIYLYIFFTFLFYFILFSSLMTVISIL